MARTNRELTDVQWAQLAPLLPPQRPKMGRPPHDHRLMLEAMLWIARTGSPWRDLPVHFGKWQTVAGRFYHWRRQGVFQRVLSGLLAQADAHGTLDWLVHFVDGSVVRAHQDAAGARRQPSKPDQKGIIHPPDEALGRSRGGWSTKLHLRTEGHGRPMVILATAGQAHENPILPALMEAGAVKRPGPGGRPGRGVAPGSDPTAWWASRAIPTPTPGPTCGVVGSGW
jgi:transposase